MTRGIQSVHIEVWDENITAAFNQSVLDVTAELECRAVNDWEGAHGFYRDFISYEDQDICYPIDIDGESYTKAELQAKLPAAQFTELEEIILEAEDVDAWRSDDD